MTDIPESSKEFIIPKRASVKPALFKKFENIDAQKSKANNFAASKDASLKTSRYPEIFRLPLNKTIKKAPAAPIPTASVAENNPINIPPITNGQLERFEYLHSTWLDIRVSYDKILSNINKS